MPTSPESYWKRSYEELLGSYRDLAEQNKALRDVFAQIVAIDQDDWGYNQGWRCVEFIQQLATLENRFPSSTESETPA